MGVQSPQADQGLTGLVSWETRSDELTRLADDISQIPGGKGLTGTGGGTLPIAGEIEVDEVFLEVSVPVISGLNFAEKLVSQLATVTRTTQQKTGTSNSFDTDTWFAGVGWAVNDEIRRRKPIYSAESTKRFDLYGGINTGLVDLSTGENGLLILAPLLQVLHLRRPQPLAQELV